MLRALLSIGGLQLLTMVVLLARTKILAILLGPDQYGVMAVIDKLLALSAQIASLSLPFAAIRFLPALWVADRAAFARQLRSMALVVLALSMAAAGCGIVVTAALGVQWGEELAEYDRVITVGFLTVPVLALVPFLQGALAGRLAHRESQAFQVAHALVFAASGVGGVLLAGLPGIYAAYALLGAGLVLWRGRALWLEAGAAPARAGAGDLRLPRTVWRFSLVMFGVAFLTPYAALFTHYLVLQQTGTRAAGWMQAALGIALAVRGVLGTGHSVFLTPNVNRGGSPAERMQWAVAFQRTFCLLALVVVPPLLLAVDLAVHLLYSPAFGPAAGYVFLFVLVEIVGMLAATYQAIIVALDRLAFHVLQNTIAQLLIISLAAWLVPDVGITGVAAATLTAQTFLYAATSWYLHNRFGLKPDRRTLALTAFLVAVVIVTGLAGQSGHTLDASTAAVRLALYSAVLALVPLLTTAEERRRARTIVRDAAGRFGWMPTAP
jgi:PST family polysaccharide transporter